MIFQYMEIKISDILTRIKLIREQNEITQRELSIMSGISYSTLTKLETGIIKNPSFLVILKISRALDIKLDDLLVD